MRRAIARLAPVLILALATLVGCSIFLPRLTPARTELGAPRVEVPLRIVAAIPLVQASVDGGPPRWFIVDSGAAGCVLSKRAAARLSPRSPSGVLTATDGNHDTSAATVRLRQVRVGEARFDDVLAIVLDLSDIEARFGVELDGILGFPLFEELTWTLDYPGQRLVLERETVLRPDGGHVMPMEIDGDRHPSIRIDFAGHDEAFVIDTGSDSVFDVPSATASRLSLRAGPVDFPAARLAFGTSSHQAARLAGTAIVGRYRFVDPMLSLMKSDRQAIGGKVLASFAITFDPRHGAVRIVRSEPGSYSRAPEDLVVRMAAKRSLGVRIEKRAGHWRVVELSRTPGMPPSPLEVGDEIVATDEWPALPADLDEEYFARRIQLGATLHLEVLRGEKRLKIDAPVTTLVP